MLRAQATRRRLGGHGSISGPESNAVVRAVHVLIEQAEVWGEFLEDPRTYSSGSVAVKRRCEQLLMDFSPTNTCFATTRDFSTNEKRYGLRVSVQKLAICDGLSVASAGACCV